MGIFSSILNKLRQHGSASAAQSGGVQQTSASTQQPQGRQQQGGTAGQEQGRPAAQSGMQGSPQASMQNVDIDAVLSDLAGKKGGGGNYRTSIVDLLKLLDLDSSLDARKELAQELNVNAGAHGSAEQNIALHKAVMRKIEENGGKVPESMRN
jgi:hypothetical protein